MTIPCSSMQMKNFSIFSMGHFYGFPDTFSIDLLVRFFERDMIGDFNGTVSNIKLYEVSKCCTKFGDFIKK